jgi:hypothetical protein
MCTYIQINYFILINHQQQTATRIPLLAIFTLTKVFKHFPFMVIVCTSIKY